MHISRLPIGTILKVWCPSKLVYHYGVLSYRQTVIDMAPRKGVARRTVRDFSEGQEINIVPRESGDAPLHEIHNRALSQIGSLRYSIKKGNCEHFVTWCRKGIWESKQFQKATDTLAVAALAFVAYNLFGGEE